MSGLLTLFRRELAMAWSGGGGPLLACGFLLCLTAILPLAAWANRLFFRAAVVIYSAVFSFLVLPRGLALNPGAVITIYTIAATGFAVICAAGWWWYRRFGRRSLN